MPLTSRTLIAAAILALGAVGAYELIKSRAGKPENAVRPAARVAVQVGALRRMTMRRYVTGYGVVGPAPATAQTPAAAAAIAAPVTGVVTIVAVTPGAHVRRGQVLVELDSATMTETYAAEEVARQRQLYRQHNTSLKALQNAEARLALLRVTAPLSGTVVRVNVKPGSAVGSTTEIAEVMNLNRLVVRTEIPEEEAAQLAPGQPLEVLANPRLSGTVAYVSPTVDAGDGAVQVWANLPRHSGLRPGQYVPLRIVTATHRNALVAPRAGVVIYSGGRSVMSLVHGNEAIQIPVRVGLRSRRWVEVRGPGLKTGTAVVTVGAYGLPPKAAIQNAVNAPSDSTNPSATPAS
ncbi:MAG: efflux RND transporter periplasmic adaptor subunit [Acidiferrobacterales bacterium]